MVGAAAVLAAGRPRPGGRPTPAGRHPHPRPGRTLLAAFTPFTAASPRPGHVPGRNRTRSTSRSLSPRCCPTFSSRPHDSCPTPLRTRSWSTAVASLPDSGTPPACPPRRRRCCSSAPPPDRCPQGWAGAPSTASAPGPTRGSTCTRVAWGPTGPGIEPKRRRCRQPGSHEAPRRSIRAAPRGLRARASWLPTPEQGVTMTTSARAWPFAMTRAMRTDYRLVAAPDFLLHSGQAAGLNAAANGNIDPDCVHLRPCSGPEGLETVVRIPCGAAARGGRRQTGRHGTRRVRPSHPAHRRHRMPAASRRSAGARPNGRSTPSKASAPRPLDSTEGLASSTAR